MHMSAARTPWIFDSCPYFEQGENEVVEKKLANSDVYSAKREQISTWGIELINYAGPRRQEQDMTLSVQLHGITR